MEDKIEYDLNIIYDLKESPDINSGRCDNCSHGGFKSYIQDSKLVRKCKNCGMMKSI
ncbi:hypothetical protein M3572_07255 [Lederbergia lenta]|nr:hypothetical protein [Lederbergia lenta]